MYEERATKILHMTLDELKKWEVPEGWALIRMGGEWRMTAPSVMPGHKDWEFDVRVTIAKGVSIHGI